MPCPWWWTDCISSWSRLWIPSQACSPQGVGCSHLQEGKMGIKLQLQPEEWGSCDNSWTLLQLFKDSVLFWEGVYFGLGDFWFFYNEDLRLKRDWQQRLGSGPCWPGSSGFWILLCASNCRTGLGIVHGKFCQNIFWIFYHFCKLCTENEKHKAHPLKKKKYVLYWNFSWKKKNYTSFYLAIFKNPWMCADIDVCKLWKYCDPCNLHLSTIK